MGRVPRSKRGKKRALSAGKPEDASNQFLEPAEASRYSTCQQTQQVQDELTEECIRILEQRLDGSLQKGSLLLNVGCGSGLCSKVVTRRGLHSVGADISGPMLREADESVNGMLVQTDCFGRLPFRDAEFDHAISVSALQWLCAGLATSTPASPEMAGVFFGELSRVLKDRAVFVAQLYPRHQEDVELLEDAARAIGWCGAVVTAFPHTTRAKKKFLCLQKEVGPCLSLAHSTYHPCPLSWPFRTPCGGSIQERLAHEHAEYSDHALRLLRRAFAGAESSQTTQEQVSYDVFSVRCSRLVPCGGSLSMHMWATTGESEQEDRKRRTEDIIRTLVGDGIAFETTSTVHKTKKGTPADWLSWGSAYHPTQDADGAKKTNPHFSLQPLLPTAPRTLAVLKSPKLPPLVAIFVDLSTPRPLDLDALNALNATVIGIDVDQTNASAAVLLYVATATPTNLHTILDTELFLNNQY